MLLTVILSFLGMAGVCIRHPDGMWPRGLRKDQAGVNLWLKAIAPSAELRTWSSHDPKCWDEFRRRYFAELDNNAVGLSEYLKNTS